MNFELRVLSRAEFDVNRIVGWLHELSPAGAANWLNAYEEALSELRINALVYSVVDELSTAGLKVRKFTFKTQRGNIYRLLYFIEGETANILRVRGPGQEDPSGKV